MHIDHSSYIGVYGSLFRSLNSFVIFTKTCGFVKRSYTIPAATLDAYKAPLSPMEWINEEGNDIKDELLTYLKPLIQGEVQIPYENGIPKRFIL